MIGYASRTGTRRNLALLRLAGWRLLVSRAGVWRTEGFPYALDNGAWTDFKTGAAFDGDNFRRLLDKLGAGADFVIAPDIVAGGLRSLDLSLSWLGELRALGRPVLIPVQDGMTPADLAPLVGPDVGIFMGGSTEWKLAQMVAWGRACAGWRVHYHVGRVNTGRRIRLAAEAGATSIDGSSLSRFAVNVEWMDAAIRQGDLFDPRALAA